MGKTGKWIKSILTGRKEKGNNPSTHLSSVATESPATPIVIPPSSAKEKRRWSFRRSSANAGGAKDSNPSDGTTLPAEKHCIESERDQKKHALVVAAATVAAADAAVAAAQAAAAVIRLTTTNDRKASAIEEAAAIKIQSVFRSYLARKALRALRGLVKLQALVRGHLVRKQATATLRCMQALVTAQARARAQRIMTVETANHRQSTHRRSTTDKFRNYETDWSMEENIKIVEMDLGESKNSSKSRNSYSNHHQSERIETQTQHRFSTHHASQQEYAKRDLQQISPSPSAITDFSPRTFSGHFEDYAFNTAQRSPQYYSTMSKPDPSSILFSFPRPEYAESMSYDFPLYPNYMANTESSRAKARSQSAPKQRPESFERQPSRRKGSAEGRNIPKAVRMQRSSSHVGSTAQNYQYPWSVKLDKSAVSLKESECGSTCSVLTNPIYCRSVVSYDPHGSRY